MTRPVYNVNFDIKKPVDDAQRWAQTGFANYLLDLQELLYLMWHFEINNLIRIFAFDVSHTATYENEH